jgi:hypothetical protein
MTPGKFFIFSLLGVGLSLLVKLVFLTTLNIDNYYVVYLMWGLVGVITIACCRRLGVISYLEAVFVLGAWLIFEAFFDLLIISTITGPSVYGHLHLWISYLVMAVCVFLFHKKRHVEVRHIQRQRAREQQPPPH